jgi:ribonuclease P protein component
MADQRFPASRRILNSKDFDAVFKNNRYRVSTPEFLMLARRNQLEDKRLGMVVSKRITSLAVNRNHLKRLIREVFRRTEITSLDIVVLTRTRVNLLQNSELIEVLTRSFTTLSNQSAVNGDSVK